MSRAFCPHLADYGANFARAEAAYAAMTVAIDRILENGSTPDHLDLLEVAVGDWRHEVKQLRERFLALVRRGAVGLPEADGEEGDGPACTACGFAVPRLSWSEWDVAGRERPTFRGAALPVGEALSVP